MFEHLYTDLKCVLVKDLLRRLETAAFKKLDQCWEDEKQVQTKVIIDA